MSIFIPTLAHRWQCLVIYGYVQFGSISNTGWEEDVIELIDEFQAVYKQRGRYDLKSQVPYLSRLAETYVRRSETSSLKWVELLKVCNSVVLVAIEMINEQNYV